MAQNQLKNSSSNKIAKELKDRRYHQRVIKNKKRYERSIYKNASRNSEREMSDLS
jgi:hypothetical protein